MLGLAHSMENHRTFWHAAKVSSAAAKAGSACLLGKR
jgi:hypothetical protein